MELLEMASHALRELVEADSGFFLYRKRGLLSGSRPEASQMYVPWGVFEPSAAELQEALKPLMEENVALDMVTERWILAEDISNARLKAVLAKYPLLELGIWPIISREETRGAVVVARSRAVSSRMTFEMSNALVDSCAAQLSVALDLITAFRIAEAASERDLLTGVFNRRGIESNWERFVQQERDPGERVVLGIVDLDDFKAINDNFGHPVGDHVLREVADVIANCLDPEDMVGRMGGDEFIVLLTNCACDWAGPMRRIQEAVASRKDSVLHSVSVGGAVWGVDGDDYETCYRVADRRLYEDKRRRKLVEGEGTLNSSVRQQESAHKGDVEAVSPSSDV